MEVAELSVTEAGLRSVISKPMDNDKNELQITNPGR